MKVDKYKCRKALQREVDRLKLSSLGLKATIEIESKTGELKVLIAYHHEQRRWVRVWSFGHLAYLVNDGRLDAGEQISRGLQQEVLLLVSLVLRFNGPEGTRFDELTQQAGALDTSVLATCSDPTEPELNIDIAALDAHAELQKAHEAGVFDLMSTAPSDTAFEPTEPEGTNDV